MNDDLINIWISYTEQAGELTNKRLTANVFFFSLVSVLAGLAIPNLGLTSLLLSIFEMILIVLWFITILSYRKLNTAKFMVIDQIEEEMKIKPYRSEWENAKKNKYISLTLIEIITCCVMFISMVALIILSILRMMSKI